MSDVGQSGRNLLQQGWFRLLVLVLVAAGVSFPWGKGLVLKPKAPPSLFDEAPESVEPVVARDHGFVGPQACAECHAKRVEEFSQTRHHLACVIPDPEKMPKGFEAGQGQVASDDPGIRFEMTREGKDFFHTAIRKEGDGEKRYKSPVGLVYGSAGVGDEVYHIWHGDYLQESKVGWFTPKGKWALSSLDNRAPGDLTRETTVRCLECHNTWIGHVPGTPNKYLKEGMILGVNCENCHGAGKEHVAHHQANPSDKEGKKVANPGKMTRERQIDVCAQCHSNAPRDRGPAFSFRAGEPLENHFRTNLNDKNREDDHVANQTKYMKQSKCFQKTEDLTCVTCHNPHKPAKAEHSNQSCAQCHQKEGCKEGPKLPAGVRSDCVGCHMPPRVWMNVHFHLGSDRYVPPIRRTEHKIGVYPEATREALMNWHQKQGGDQGRQEADKIRQGLVDYWLGEGEKRTKEFRYLGAIGAIREALRLNPTPAVEARLKEATDTLTKIDKDWLQALAQIDRKEYAQAVETLQGILKVKPDLARAYAKLGLLYSMKGQKDLAREHLLKVAEYDPDEAYGFNMLGWLAYLDGKNQEALNYYTKADAQVPFFPQLQYQMGLALLKLSRGADALERFEKAVGMDPANPGYQHGLAAALLQQGKAAEAIRVALKASKLSKHEDPDILLTLSNACAEAGRYADAREAATRGLPLAEKTNPDIASLLRARLRSLPEK